MAKHKQHAGAGGYWTIHDEVPDPAVMPQVGSDHCCAACIQMILEAKGISTNQQQIASRIGIPTATTRLASELNKADPTHIWQYDFFPDFTVAIPRLTKRAPWIAFMKDLESPILHAVIVDGQDESGNLLIRDPWPSGTSYAMTIPNFSDLHHGWTGMAIAVKTRRPRPRLKLKSH